MIKKIANRFLDVFGFEIRRTKLSRASASHKIPDARLYRPLFSPWYGEGEFARLFEIAATRTLVSRDRCWILYSLARQALAVPGDFWECGVYRGGTAVILSSLVEESRDSRNLYLFDTFQGMPETDAKKDLHRKGDFSASSLQAVQDCIGEFSKRCIFRRGFIPDTFVGLEGELIAFAHVDVDIYRSVLDCLNFIWPRLSLGGFIVLDDYGFSSCPGARKAVDDFFSGSPTIPLCLPTGQAIVFKH